MGKWKWTKESLEKRKLKQERLIKEAHENDQDEIPMYVKQRAKLNAFPDTLPRY